MSILILHWFWVRVLIFFQGHFARDGVEVLTNSRVKEVKKDKVLFSQVENGETVVKEIPTGFCLWSTGVCKSFSPSGHPFTESPT